MKIISLTYHEITEDPRVLKQARALAAAGHDVTVFCEWPDGRPEREIIDGVAIRRFHVYSDGPVSREAFAGVDFLEAARPAVMERLEPYLAAADRLSALERLGAGHPLLTDRRGSPEYYKSHRGAGRIARKVEHKLFVTGLSRRIARDPGLLAQALGGEGAGSARMVRRRLRGHVRERAEWRTRTRAARRELFQEIGFVYAINLLDAAGDAGADVVHAHDIYCLPGGVVLSRRLGARLVYDAHEYEPARATKMPTSGADVAEAIEDDCFRFVDRMITVSGSIADLYAARFPGPPPVIVMNAPEIDGPRGPEPEPAPSIRDLAGLGPEVPLLVFTGGVQMSHRGVDKVVTALRLLPGCHLVCLGPRHPTNDRALLDHAERQGVRGRVTLLPPVDARDVPAAISTGDVALCPFQDVSLNHRFAMPNKLFEAAFAGIPICVSDLPEMRAFVERLGFGRAMDQTDPAAIADAVRDVLDHPGRFRLTDEARRLLREEYGWAAQAAKLLALYDELGGGRGTAGGSASDPGEGGHETG